MEGEFRLPVRSEPKINTAQLRWGKLYLQKEGLFGIGLVCFDKAAGALERLGAVLEHASFITSLFRNCRKHLQQCLIR